MHPLSVREVFTSGGTPTVTYVQRDHLHLESQVGEALNSHSFIIVSGPTKCGKSVLCRRVIGHSNMVSLDGGKIDTIESFWKQIAFHLKISTSITKTRTRNWTFSGSIGLILGIPSALKKILPPVRRICDKKRSHGLTTTRSN